MSSYLHEANSDENLADGKPADHLEEGDVFSIFGLNGENVYKVAKLVKKSDDDLHIFVFYNPYPHRPAPESLDRLIVIPAWVDVQRSREWHYPVSRKLFSLMRPIILGNRSVRDIELNGYRQWCLTENKQVLGTDICLEDEIEEDLRVYLRIFFSYAVPTCISFTLYTMFLKAFHLIGHAVTIGISFGAIMVVLQWASIRRHRNIPHRVSASSRQFTEIELPLPFHAAFELGVRALGSINNCRPIIVDARGGTIEARVAKTIVDEGQEILMVFSRINDRRTVCVVWSESPPGVTFDMGKNLGNLSAIISYLKSSADLKQPFSADLSDNKASSPDQPSV